MNSTELQTSKQILTRFCNNRQCIKFGIAQKVNLGTKNCGICGYHVFKSRDEEIDKWNSALGIVEPHTDPEAFLSPAPWLAPKLICSGSQPVHRPQFNSNRSAHFDLESSPKESLAISQHSFPLATDTDGQDTISLQDKKFIHVRVRPRCPAQVSTPYLVDELERPCFIDMEDTLYLEQVYIDNNSQFSSGQVLSLKTPKSSRSQSRSRSNTPSKASKSTGSRYCKPPVATMSCKRELPYIDDQGIPLKDVESPVPIKGCTMSEDEVGQEVTIPIKRDALSWGRTSPAARRLCVHLAKRASSVPVAQTREESGSLVATVNLLQPVKSVLTNLPPAVSHLHGQERNKRAFNTQSGSNPKPTVPSQALSHEETQQHGGSAAPQQHAGSLRAGSSAALAFHRISARPDPGILEAGRLVKIPRENPFRKLRCESPPDARPPQGILLDVVGAGLSAHTGKRLPETGHSTGETAQPKKVQDISNHELTPPQGEVTILDVASRAAAGDGALGPGTKTAKVASHLAGSLPSNTFDSDTLIAADLPKQPWPSPGDSSSQSDGADAAEAFGRRDALSCRAGWDTVPAGKRGAAARQEGGEGAGQGRHLAGDWTGTTAGVTVSAGQDRSFSSEIETALRTAERLVVEGRELDARRVEGRRQRAGRNVQRLEAIAREALFRLAVGRLGAAWRRWGEAVREGRNLRVLAQRTRLKPVQVLPQMRPRLCARRLQLETDAAALLAGDNHGIHGKAT